jgi:hypothetical protein
VEMFISIDFMRSDGRGETKSGAYSASMRHGRSQLFCTYLELVDELRSKLH